MKSGDELELRPPEKDDEQRLIDFFTVVPPEDLLFLKEDVTDPAVIKGWLSDMNHDRVFPLLALSGDKVVADGTLHRNTFGWSKHVAEVRVVVARDWQRKGVSQIVVRELVARAIDTGVEILEVNVLEGQHGALRAFERIGFKVETVLKNRATDRTGRKRDVLVMTRDVSELWRQMEDMITDMEYAPRGH
jgi:RimJ/RimL family protein N-acetyltransferase